MCFIPPGLMSQGAPRFSERSWVNQLRRASIASCASDRAASRTQLQGLGAQELFPLRPGSVGTQFGVVRGKLKGNQFGASEYLDVVWRELQLLGTGFMGEVRPIPFRHDTCKIPVCHVGGEYWQNPKSTFSFDQLRLCSCGEDHTVGDLRAFCAQCVGGQALRKAVDRVSLLLSHRYHQERPPWHGFFSR